jgi:Peptidase of plants and bacteria
MPPIPWPEIKVAFTCTDKEARDVEDLLKSWLDTVSDISKTLLPILYEYPADVPKVTHIHIFIDVMPGVAHTTGSETKKEIHLSSAYFRSHGGDKVRELMGVLWHEMTHVWQHSGLNHSMDGGLIEGIADYVRLKSGYIPAHWNSAKLSDRWNAGYESTAFFLDWVETYTCTSFVKRVNLYFRNSAWDDTDDVFLRLTGSKLEQLWSTYCSERRDAIIKPIATDTN